MNADEKMERALTQGFIRYATEELEAIRDVVKAQQARVESLRSMARNAGTPEVERQLESIWHRLNIWK